MLRTLAELGQHRALSIPDLMIAATAETMRLTVLHFDKEFKLIAGITGQRRSRRARRDDSPDGDASAVNLTS